MATGRDNRGRAETKCGQTRLLNKERPIPRTLGTSRRHFLVLPNYGYLKALHSDQKQRSCISRVWHTSLLASATDWRHPAHTVLGIQLDGRRSAFNDSRIVHDADLEDSGIAKSFTLSPEGGAAVTAEAATSKISQCPEHEGMVSLLGCTY